MHDSVLSILGQLPALQIESPPLNLKPGAILGIIGAYFLLLIFISWLTSRKSVNENEDFFTANRKSPWYLVAFGMIGASLSGVTFISLPGAVGGTGANQEFAYMQMVFGYLVGYTVIALVLLPLYYRLNLTSIYSYLGDRFGPLAHKTGAAFFLISRTIGASFRLFLVALVMDYIFVQGGWNVPIWATVLGTIILIWLYTFRSGIKTIVWTDTLQTTFMLLAVIFTVIGLASSFGGGWSDVSKEIGENRIFFFEEGWSGKSNFFKQFVSGIFMAIVMTGLDQDMMQKNLTCRSLGDAQKNMFSFSVVLVVVNFIFLLLGALLYLYMSKEGISVPETGGNSRPDLVYPMVALQYLSPAVGIIFILGLVAAAYSSADSALTALTTSFCVDFLGFGKKESKEINVGKKSEDLDEILDEDIILKKSTTVSNFDTDSKTTRYLVHIGFSVLLFLVILGFWFINDQSVITQLFVFAGYTYGPILGLFAYGIFVPKRKHDFMDALIPFICILAPILSFFINKYSETLLFGYKFGFELLLVNGLITFLGLLLLDVASDNKTNKHKNKPS